MKKFISRELKSALTENQEKHQKDVVKFAKALGFEELTVTRFATSEKSEKAFQESDPLTADFLVTNTISPADPEDLVIFQYPFSRFDGDDTPQFLAENLLLRLKERGIRAGLLVEQEMSAEEEAVLLSDLVDFVIVPTHRYRDSLMESGAVKPLLVLDFQDQTTETPLQIPQFLPQISIVGTTIDRELPTPAYVFNPASPAGFGLVFEKSWAPYAAREDLSAFLTVGMPVIVEAGSPWAQLVEENRLGYVISDLEMLPFILESVDQKSFSELTSQTMQIAQLLRSGHFLQKVLIQLDAYAFLKADNQRPISF